MSKPHVCFGREMPPDQVGVVTTEAGILGPAGATPDDPCEMLSRAVRIIASVCRHDGEPMGGPPNLRRTSRTGIAYDRTDLAATATRGIAICNTPDVPTISTAGHAVTPMIWWRRT